MTSALRSLLPALMAILIGVLATRRRLVNRLLAVQATNPDRATPLSSRGPLTRWWLGRLVDAGVIRSVGHAQYWLNEELWHQYRSTRRRRVLGVASLIATMALVAFVLDRLGVLRAR